MSEKLYPYSTGELLKSPNTYIYTPFRGKEFIDEYVVTRINYLNNNKKLFQNYSVNPIISGIIANLTITTASEELLEYFGDNLCAVINKSATVDASHVLQNALETGESKTSLILEAALLLAACGKHVEMPRWCDLFEKMRRNIEVKRLLFERYKSGLKRGVGPCDNIYNYCKLSSLLALGMKDAGDLQTLNALLKTNDILLSTSKENNSPEEIAFAVIGIIVECNSVRFLMAREGVECATR